MVINTAIEPIENPSIQVKPKQRESYGVTLGGLRNIKDAAREKMLSDAKEKSVKEITSDNLSKAWNGVVELMASEKVLYKSAILESELTFSDFVITIHANVVALDFLKSERLRLLDHFKLYYQNEQVNVLFAAKVSKLEQEGSRVLSTREVFDVLSVKNPHLRQLKDKLGMDFEY